MEGGQLLVEGLLRLGVKHIFINSGSDHAPIIEAIAEREAAGREVPKMIVVPHEGPAMAMGHGHSLATGRPSVILVHTTPGTANALAGLMNASSARVPLILMAGRTPIRERGRRGSRNLAIHWTQESRDQGALVREFVKWDYELRDADQIPELLARSYEMARAPPQGPVYLILPRERLCAQVEEPITFPSLPDPPRLQADQQLLEEACKMLAQADKPLIITRYLGRDQRGVELLVELAERLAAGVIQTPEYLNFPMDHPLYLGSNPSPYLREADALLLVEVEVPWIPERIQPPQDAKVVHIDLDPHHQRLPIWGFPCSLIIQADPALALEAMNHILEGLGVAKGARQDRLARLRGLQEERRRRFLELVNRSKGERPIALPWLAHCLEQVIQRERAILVSESVTSRLEEMMLGLNRPGSLFRTPPFGALGWGMGAALGIKLARPEELVIAVVGDGSYMYDVPIACHFVAKRYSLPILTIIINNGAWNATIGNVKHLYPEGYAVRNSNFPGCELLPSPHYERIMEAFDGHGERVEDPQALPEALYRAVKEVKKGRQALLNVVCQASK